MEYKWKPGTRAKIKAQVAGDELESIRKGNDGLLTPQVVLEQASDPESPIHDGFEWDDSTAANLHREQEARLMINHLTVTISEVPGSEPTRAFVSIRVDDSPRYTSIQVALATPELRKQVLDKALKEARAWQDRYNEYEELTSVFAAISEASAA